MIATCHEALELPEAIVRSDRTVPSFTTISASVQPMQACSSRIASDSRRSSTGAASVSGTIGAPTAPNETPTTWPIRATSSARSAGTPSATSMGATIATGVPKPEAPSRNIAKK